MPIIHQLRGQNGQESIVAQDPDYEEPFPNAMDMFDKKVHQIVKPEHRTWLAENDSKKKASRGVVSDIKRKLKEKLQKGRYAGSFELIDEDNLGSKKPELIPVDGSEFFGGRWANLIQPNPCRYTHLLPNDVYCSSHIALCATFEINDNYLSSQWQ